MNRKARAIAKRMAEGTFSSQDRADFKAAVLVLGWEGVRGGGVLNHTTGERERSYQTLASRLLWEASGITKEAEELEAIERVRGGIQPDRDSYLVAWLAQVDQRPRAELLRDGVQALVWLRDFTW